MDSHSKAVRWHQQSPHWHNKNVGGLKKDSNKAISAGDRAQSFSRFGKGLFNLVHSGWIKYFLALLK